MNQRIFSGHTERIDSPTPSHLPASSRQRFFEDGFLKLDHFVTGDDLRQLSTLYNEIVTDVVGCPPHELCSRNPFEQHLMEKAPPPEYEPRLRQSPFFSAARQLVAQLANVDEARLRTGWRLFFKPGGYRQTFWHQDAAYRLPPHDSISVWCTLDDATFESSCLSYIPGSHRADLHKHKRHYNHLMAIDVNTAAAVPCPVDAGGITVHHCRTLHYAGPNQTRGARRALVLVCGNALLFS